jgi:hypothetical protein
MKKYDIDSVRIYQAVMFNRSNETFFSTRKINHTPGRKIEILEELQALSIKSDKDHIIVPLTNVSAIYLKSPLKIEQAEKDEAERLRSVSSSQPKRVRQPILKP